MASKLIKAAATKTRNVNTIRFEAATLARFADGACTCSLGDTSVLVTAVGQPVQRKESDSFIPLTIDYREKAAAAGRIPMTHLRRDIGVTDRDLLTSRMIDRSVRASFAKGFNLETQIVCNILAVDGLNQPDVLAINGASASLSISDIPWDGPIGAVRVGLVGENVVLNPTRKESENSRLNLVISANKLGNITMLEGFSREPILLPDVQKAMKGGIKECQTVIKAIQELKKSIGKPKRVLDLSPVIATEEQKKFTSKLAKEKLKEIFSNHTYDKISRDQAVTLVKIEVNKRFKETFPDATEANFSNSFSQTVRHVYKELLDVSKTRCDGRHVDQLRPISCKVDLYKPLHGSALFQRGQTQVFCSTTFDTPDAAIMLSGAKEKKFMLHYEFPPYAVNEIGKISNMPNRREIGHGALAEKAIRPVVPEQNDMAIRLNCEVLESNGSSSMASVCAGSMSLMDAGVKLQEHVAGVAIGLISAEENEPNGTDHLLTDILGLEDYIGDMDFKIAGTKRGLTALQLDVKPITGLCPTMAYKAMQKAHTARGEIINHMNQAIKEARLEKKKNHPVMKSIHVPPHKKSKFIGFGSVNLKKLMADVGVRVSANEGEEGDNFMLFAPNQEAMEEAEEFIKQLLEKDVKEPVLDFNGIYTATIVELRPSGVMVTLYPDMVPALLPNSQLDIRPIAHPSALNFEVGQQIQIKYFGRDPASGHMRLSRKSLLMSANTKTSTIH